MRFTAALLAMLGAAAHANGASVAAMQGHRRILLIAAPAPHDPRAAEQRRSLGGWSSQAAARDIMVIELNGARVTGATDAAAALRQRYKLDPGGFRVLLIGKDGNVALRSTRPVAADRLQATIDAMPMRQAGER